MKQDEQVTISPLQALYFRDISNDHLAEILDEIYVKKVYYPYLYGRKDLTIVDIGANIGLTSYYFKDFAKRVYAVEPAAMHRETLSKMLEFNKVTNVEILPYAISNTNGKTTFHHSPNTTSFSLTELDANGTTEEVETLTIDSLLAKYAIERVDILKLDAEGEESKIVTSDGFINNTDKFPFIIGEWHAWTEMNQNQFMNHFRELGYHFMWLRTTVAACFVANKI